MEAWDYMCVMGISYLSVLVMKWNKPAPLSLTSLNINSRADCLVPVGLFKLSIIFSLCREQYEVIVMSWLRENKVEQDVSVYMGSLLA